MVMMGARKGTKMMMTMTMTMVVSEGTRDGFGLVCEQG